MKSPSAIAQSILSACLAGEEPPPALLEELVEWAGSPEPARAVEGSRALFGTLVEGLSDRFDPRLTQLYGVVFARVIAAMLREFGVPELVERYDRVRRPRPFIGDPGSIENVFVLSRVTLGADVAITSLALDAAKRLFPHATIWIAGGAKTWELFAADTRLKHLPVAYSRGGILRERLAVAIQLRSLLERPNRIVIDPDSRLTQLGLVPVCPEECYFLFDSRSGGGDGSASLGELMRRWLEDTFGIADARPYLAPRYAMEIEPGSVVSVSFGVGENAAKRLSGTFERDLLRLLTSRGLEIVIDTGAGGEEAERVRTAVEQARAKPGQVRMWQGSFAPFAGMIERSRLYIGYDSAGQHVAAACGVPLVTIFAGFPSERMFHRWQPSGPGPKHVVRVEQPDSASVLAETARALDSLLGTISTL